MITSFLLRVGIRGIYKNTFGTIITIMGHMLKRVWFGAKIKISARPKLCGYYFTEKIMKQLPRLKWVIKS